VKKIQLLTITLLLFTIACKKSGEKIIEPIENSLIGKWTYTEYYMGSGAPSEWRPVTPPNQTIEFKPGGTFIPSESFLKDADHFEILDSVTVKFQPTSTSSGFILMGYSIDTMARQLQMYPVNPMCIEGCSNKFKK
jgi:hypothetical protein